MYPLVIPLRIFYLVLNREESGGVEGHKKDVYIPSGKSQRITYFNL